MKFTPTWRTNDVADIPSFKELEDITGMAYDENGVYAGPKEKPDMQLVIDQRTKRQYWAPKEYDEDAIRYGMAKLEQDFNSKEWWGMVQNPDLSFTEKISTAYIEGLKQAGKLVANAPTKIAGAVAGATDAFGIDAGAAVMASLKMNPIFLASNVSRKGLKATAEDYVQLFKDLKTPKGKMGTTASYWRATANNWEETVNKYLPDVDENVKAHSTMVAIGGLAGQIGGSLLIAAATNGVGGLPAVAAVFGGQQFYDIREEYLQKGYDLDAANIFAGFAALAEGGLEAVGFGNLLKYGTLSRSFRNTLIGGLIESVQEMSQTSAEELITNLSGVREETLAQILTQIAISGVAGFIPGMGFSLMVGGENIAQEKAAYELDRAVEQQKQQQATPAKEGQTLPGTTPKQELELAKTNKGSNPVYETVKNIANAHGVTDEKAIDGFYYFARNQALQGKLGEQLLEGLGKQIVAYKNQLNGIDKAADQDNKNAAEAIKRHLSAESAQEYHDANVKAMEESGIEKNRAEVAAAQLDILMKNLSEKLGLDLQKFKKVVVRAIPRVKTAQAKQEEAPAMQEYSGEVPFQDRQGGSEADNEIKTLQRQINELDKMARSKPRTTLLSTLRKTGVDYSNTRLDPQVLKDLKIKNVPVAKGGLGGESLDYLIQHGFMQDYSQGEQVSYEMAREKEGEADEMLERAVSGEDVYRMDDMEKIRNAEQAEAYKQKLQAELDEKIDQEGKRGYIKIGDMINEIVLGRNSDVTTLQHEMIHHFRNLINLLAAQGNKNAIALKEQMDSIIEKHKDEVRQKINSEEEVLSEAYEAWLYGGVVAENPTQQKLFDALKQFFREVYDSVRAITGIRIDPEIDMFFRQLTGEMPIQMREEATSPSGKYDYKVTNGEKYGFTQEQREHIAKEVIDNMEGSLFSRFKVKDVKGEQPLGGYWKSRQTWWTDEKGKKTKEPEKADAKYQSDSKEVIKINVPNSKAVLTVHKDPLAIRAMFKDLGISITPKPEYANDMMYQEGIKYDKNGKADINSPEFKKWFGNSKVVDEQGRPKIYHHKSYAENIEVFIVGKGTNAGGKGIYFSERPEGRYGNIDYPVYLKVENPKIVNGLKRGQSLAARKQGYDGIIDKQTGYVIVFNPNQIKSVYNKGTFDESNPNIYYQFGGQKAKTADPLKLNKAEEMEASGADNETIRQETGWFRGADRKWRFEISDQDASVSKAVSDFKKGAVDDTNTFNKEIDKFNEKLQKLSEEEKHEEYQKVMDQKLRYIDEHKKPKEHVFKLGDFLKHDSLYKAYPELKDLRLEIVPLGENTAGAYSRGQNKIQLSASMVVSYSEDNTKKTLLHEIAHYIQQREGFAKGGDPSKFRDKRLPPRMKKLAFGRAMDSAILYNALLKADTKGLEPNLQWPAASYIERFMPELEKIAASDDKIKRTLERWQDENEQLKEYDNNTAIMKYKRLGGEVEARNVEKRADFTPLETAMISPESTQDVKNADAIIQFDDGTQLAYNKKEPEVFYQGDKDLIAVHAAKSWHINEVLESGQLVAPSISITKKGQNELNKGNFGDVVLVMNPNRIKYNRDNIYNRDIYSPRLPSPVYKTEEFGYISQSEYENYQRQWEENPDAFKKKYGGTFDELVGNDKYIFEGFNPRTEKRIYKKYTPANLLSYVKKESLLGGESLNYGLSSFLAKMSVKLNNREELRKESWNLTNREEAEEKYEELEKAYSDLLYGDIQKYSKFSEVSEEDFADFLKYNYEGHPEKAAEFLNVDEIPDSLKVMLKDFVDEALSLPRSYFEAKPMRLVPLSDFVYAITKKGTLTKEQKEKFESYGVEVKEVDSIKDFDFSSLDTGEANDTNAVGVYFQPGYHGGAAKFEKFDLQFVGTGEGAQAHGWGVYIAGSRETAEGYRERTVLGRGINREYEFFIGDKKLDEETSFLINNNISTSTLMEAAKGNKEELRNGFDRVIGEWKKTFVELLEDLRARRDFILANPKMSLAAYAKKYNDSRTKYALQNAREVARTFNSRANIQNVLAQLEESIKIYEGYYDRNLKNAAALEAIDLDKLSVRRDEGQLYEVEIPENDVLLDEMKHFGEQPKKVQDALLKIQKDYPDTRLGQRGLWIYQDLVKQGPYSTKKENQKWASLTMLKYGIEGITYEGFRDGRCYVIFDDKAVRIRQTFYQIDRAQRTGAKAADPKPSKERIASDLDVIRNNGVEKYQKKSHIIGDIGDLAKYTLLSIRQRAGAIDNKLKAFFDKLDYFQPNLEKKFASKANGFVKKYQTLTEEEKNEFDYYVYNQCFEELQTFLKEKGMANEYQEVRQLLNFIYAISNQAGIDMGFIEEYFPTSMIDYAGFLDHMKGTDKWSYIAKALREADPEGLWSDKEKADAINKLLRGYRLDPVSKPGNTKDRTILYKSPELMKFYEHSDAALVKYLQGMSQAIAINKAFGKGKGFNTDETIGAIVLELIDSGTITHKEEAEVKRLLKSRLSYGATPKLLAMIRNVGYLQTMNNITNAITQLGDLYAPFYKYSFGTAIESIFGKSEITKADLGLDTIWEEFSNQGQKGIVKASGIAVDKLFKAIGLENMDSFGKNVSINASLINLRKQAASGDLALTERLAYTFGKDAGKVLADIKEGKVTDDIKILIWADLADTQPIGRSGVPAAYLENPRMRLFYQLKTFMLNQISLFYADSLVNIRKGIKYHNKEQLLKGIGNSFKLVLLLTAGNAGADVLKNLIMGRDIDITDTVVSNLLWNIGVSKYVFYKGKREGYAWTLFTSYAVPPQISIGDDIYKDLSAISQGKRAKRDSQLWTYIPFGRAYYWWFGGGSEQGKARTEKMKKKVAAKNRRTKKKENKKK